MAWKNSEKAVELFKIQICCTVVIYLSACLRFWAQAIVMKKQALHDKLMYISVLLYTAQVVVIIRGIVDGGIGQRAHTIDQIKIVKGFQTWYFGELIYAVLSGFVKTSVAIYLRSVYIGQTSGGAVVNKPFLRIGLILCLVGVWITSIVFLFISVFQCSPVGYYWGQFENTTTSGTCLASAVSITGIVLSIILGLNDWALALVPVVSLWKVGVPWKAKLPILFLSSLGILAGIAMGIRIPYIKLLDPTKDFLYETVDVAKWTVIEATLGIVAGCLPVIWPLWRPRLMSSSLSRMKGKAMNQVPTKRDLGQDTVRNNRETIICHKEFYITESYEGRPDIHTTQVTDDGFRNGSMLAGDRHIHHASK